MNKLALTLVLLAAVLAGTRLLAQPRRPVPPNEPTMPARRMALVIGNDSYAHVGQLHNARNDARAVALALRALSFEVTIVEDATGERMRAALGEFGLRLTAADLAFVFYAGHGVQVAGENYLLPVDFNGQNENDVVTSGAAVPSDVVIRAGRPAGTRVVVLDACRDNPYGAQRATGKGLAAPVREEPGLLVAFAAAAGQTADDGSGHANGRYTSELVQLLGSPGLDLAETFRRVQQRVRASTSGRQFPAVYANLNGDVVLTPASDGPWLETELELWTAIKDSSEPGPFEDYLRRYPNGQFRALAANRVPDREFVLKARLDKQTYRSGEQVGLMVESTKDAALYLIDVTADGGASLVPLGADSGPTRLRARQPFAYPSADERRDGYGMKVAADTPSEEQFWFVAFRAGVGHEGWLSRAGIPEAAGSVPVKAGSVAEVQDALRRFNRRDWTMTRVTFDVQP